MQNGIVKFFNDETWGFITGEDGKDYFVHIKNIKDQEILYRNQKVTFDVVSTTKGSMATNVSRSNADVCESSNSEAKI